MTVPGEEARPTLFLPAWVPRRWWGQLANGIPGYEPLNVITVVYRCPDCHARWVLPREGLSRNETTQAGPLEQPRLEERLCRACERGRERSLWQEAESAAGIRDDGAGR